MEIPALGKMEAERLGVQGHPLPGLQENQLQNKTMEGRKKGAGHPRKDLIPGP